MNQKHVILARVSEVQNQQKEDKRCKFWVWDDNLSKYLNQGSRSAIEVNPYLSQAEELKQKKLASHEERICLYDEQVQELKKKLAKEEAQSRGYTNGVEEQRKK
ncbi:hypothetical protein HKD37_03G006250 [Glycine soja]